MKRKFTFLLTFVLTVCLALTTGIMAAFAADNSADDGLDDTIPELKITALYYGGAWANYYELAYFNVSDITIDYWQSGFFEGYFEYRNAAGDLLNYGGNTLAPCQLVFGWVTDVARPTVGDTIKIKKGFTISGTDSEGAAAQRQLKEDVTFECTKSEDGENGVVWSIVKEAVELEVGDLTISNTEFTIPLPNKSQKLYGGFVGADVETDRSGLITHTGWEVGWSHAYVNDEDYVKLVYQGESYDVDNWVIYNGANPPVFFFYFIGIDTTSVGKGAIIRFDSEIVITDNDNRVYNFGADGLTYYNNGTQWQKVTLAESEDDITIANADSYASEFRVGNMEAANITFASGKAAILTGVESDNEEVATVNEKGEISAVGVGSANITFTFGDITKTVAVTVDEALVPDKLQVSIKDGSAFADKNGELIAYVGEELDKNTLAKILEARIGYDNGRYDAPFAVTADMISVDGYNNSAVGKSSISVTTQGLTGTLDVNVYKLDKFAAPTAANVSFYDILPYIITSLTTQQDKQHVSIGGNTLKELGIGNYVGITEAAKNGGEEHALNSVTYHFLSFAALEIEGRNSNSMELGDVLWLKKGFRIYDYIDGVYLAQYELENDRKYVYDGKRWADYVGEAEELTLAAEEVTLALGAYYTIPYTITPAGSYIKTTVTSSDTSVVSVEADGTLKALAVTEENSPVTVTVKLGNDQSTEKTISVTVKEFEITGFEVYNSREINISRGSDFSFEYYVGNDTTAKSIQAVEVYDNGSKGIPFYLSEDNTEIKNYDKDKVGVQTITLTITHGDKTFDAAVDVNVRNVAELVSDFVGADIFNTGHTCLYIGFSQSVVNEVNVPAAITADKINEFIKFKRGEDVLSVTSAVNGIYIVIEPVFPNNWADEDKVFKKGDLMILEEGMPFIRWTGDSQNYNLIGIGEYIVAGKVAYEAVYECGDNRSWSTYIDYVDFTIASESIELGYGKLGDVGATMVPSYATIGEFKITSSDTSVVSVNANGLIKGEKIGTAELTITLDHERLEPIVKKITVKVVDVKSSIKFNETKIYVPTGTVALTGQTLKDLGVTGVYVWASGKEEGEVDLANVKIQGYSANAEGEQEITVRITENGATVTGKITVVIGEKPAEEKKGCGCGSELNSVQNIATAVIIGSVMLVLAAGVLLSRKCKKTDK